MTTIVALVQSNNAWIAGDNAAGDESMPVIKLAEPKVWRSGPALMGGCGYLAPLQAIQHRVKVTPSSQSPMQYLCGTLAHEVRKAVQDSNLLGDEETTDSSLLIVMVGRIFVLDLKTFGVVAVEDHFHAIGSGSFYALGALHATQRQPPAQRIEAAVAAAARYDAGTGYPFMVLREPQRATRVMSKCAAAAVSVGSIEADRYSDQIRAAYGSRRRR